MPTIDDALGTLDDVEFLVEVVVLKDGAGLELFGDTLLPCARAFDISAPVDIFASTGGVQAAVDDCTGGGIVA